MGIRLIIRTSDQSQSKGVVLQEDETIQLLKKRIVSTIFPELNEVTFRSCQLRSLMAWLPSGLEGIICVLTKW